jgi:hypothetical protein
MSNFTFQYFLDQYVELRKHFGEAEYFRFNSQGDVPIDICLKALFYVGCNCSATPDEQERLEVILQTATEETIRRKELMFIHHSDLVGAF